MEGPSDDEIGHDAGILGILKMQMVNLDCVHQTYEVYDKRRPLREGIWRAATTLPTLTPLFKFACHRSNNTRATQRALPDQPTDSPPPPIPALVSPPAPQPLSTGDIARIKVECQEAAQNAVNTDGFDERTIAGVEAKRAAYKHEMSSCMAAHGLN
jgi:hypothetical protein